MYLLNPKKMLIIWCHQSYQNGSAESVGALALFAYPMCGVPSHKKKYSYVAVGRQVLSDLLPFPLANM
jgi:hypothetical protein